jgi:hypothetical protein
MDLKPKYTIKKREEKVEVKQKREFALQGRSCNIETLPL